MAKKDDGLRGIGIASVVCGIASWLILGIILSPISIVFGAMAMKSKDNTTKTWGTAGLVIGIVSLSLLLFSFIILASIK